MVARFNDHFSGVAYDYRRFRPLYPSSLFAFLSFITREQKTAWDCATGTGQAARALAAVFDQVIASDASRAQIDHAIKRYNVQYHVFPAEDTRINTRSIDLITVAQALHWFDIEKFFIEANRVLKPGGILAIWSYNLLTISDAVDKLINRLYDDTLRAYWPSQRKLIEENYQSIEFPFQAVQCPNFDMSASWELPQLTGYLNTWSAVSRYQQDNGRNPVDDIADELGEIWGDAKKQLLVKWPLNVIVRIKTG